MAICANLCFILNTNSRKFPQIIKNTPALIPNWGINGEMIPIE